MSSADVNPFLSSYLNGNSSPEPESRPRNAAAQPTGNEIDDLFDYDPGIDDVFRDIDTNMDVPTTTGKGDRSTGRAGTKNSAGLGIDEEVQITRKKRVNVKLDEKRLLSQAGIPKLRRIAKESLRFKGKGHEYSDAARILSLYQLWLDDLYPKAKFADALAIVEKLGHSKHMQIMRKGWIEGNTPRTIDSTQGNVNSGKAEPNMSIDENGENAGTATEITTHESLFGKGPQVNIRTLETSDLGVNEDLYSSPKVKRAAKPTPKPNRGSSSGLFISDDEAYEYNATEGIVEDLINGEDDVPEENDLDALLNDDATNAVSNDVVIKGGEALNAMVIPSKTRAEDEFEDEMEAMTGMW